MSYQTDLEFARGKANAWKHLQDPSQISYVCGLACGDALKMLEEKGWLTAISG